MIVGCLVLQVNEVIGPGRVVRGHVKVGRHTSLDTHHHLTATRAVKQAFLMISITDVERASHQVQGGRQGRVVSEVKMGRWWADIPAQKHTTSPQRPDQAKDYIWRLYVFERAKNQVQSERTKRVVGRDKVDKEGTPHVN